MHFERQYWQQDVVFVAGVDEAGRGPLAGPVVAAAVVFPADLAASEFLGELAELTDSKKLSSRDRDRFYDHLQQLPSLDIGMGMVHAVEIDDMNILRATHKAMRLALTSLKRQPGVALVDGLPVSGLPVDSKAIVKGDSKSFSIAAASVVAKVTRDRYMVALDAKYPGYGFSQHKGYGTARHMQALLELGCTPEHRRSFRPVREAEAIHQGREPAQRELSL